MRYTGPKARRCRRQGVNLYGSDKYDRILQRKPQPPGKAPRGFQGRQSEYALQLLEKQKARDMFGLSERQFRRLYEEASTVSGETGEALKRFLEQRLDNVVYRAGFAMTRLQARQFVGHGLFMLNGRRSTVPSIRVRIGNVIRASPRAQNSPVLPPILQAHEKVSPPAWLKVDPGKMTIEIIAAPSPETAEKSIDARQIIEFYSRN